MKGLNKLIRSVNSPSTKAKFSVLDMYHIFANYSTDSYQIFCKCSHVQLSLRVIRGAGYNQKGCCLHFYCAGRHLVREDDPSTSVTRNIETEHRKIWPSSYTILNMGGNCFWSMFLYHVHYIGIQNPALTCAVLRKTNQVSLIRTILECPVH